MFRKAIIALKPNYSFRNLTNFFSTFRFYLKKFPIVLKRSKINTKHNSTCLSLQVLVHRALMEFQE